MTKLLARRGAISRPQVSGGGGGGTSARFKGDPGAGKILTGATVYTGSMGEADGNVWLDNNTGVNHLLKRIYYTNLWSRTTITNYRNAGKMPSIAWKANASSANIAAMAAGSIDASIAAEAVWAAGQGYPIYTAFFHEPEDNFTTAQQATDYRATFRRFVQIFRDNGATNVVWMGVSYMAPWTFDGSGRLWWWWDPDWKGTLSGAGGSIPNASDWYTGSQAVLDVMSFDTYTPEIGASGYHEFSGSMGPCLSDMTAAGRPIKPWVVHEMGTKIATPMPSDGWTGFFQRAFRYMRDNSGAGYVYYNTDDNNFLNGSDAANRFAGYQAALASESAYLTSTRPPDAGVGGAAASVSLVGAAVAGGNVATITPTLPVAAQAGDVAYVFWSHGSTSTAIPDPPTGWTYVGNNTGSTGSVAAKILRRVLTGGDTSPALTLDGATRHSAVLVVYRGLNTATPEDGVAVDTTHTTGTTHDNPPLTTTTANCVIVTSIHERAATVDTDFTPGAGYTERGSTQTLAVGNGGSITVVADNGLALVTSGTTVTPPDWTGDSLTGTANIVTYTLALRAA